MTALVDMDGTLCDYEGAIKKELKRLLDFDVNISDPKYKNLIDTIKRQNGFWLNLPVIDIGMKVIKILESNGFQIHVLTKGPYKITNAWTEKVEWCRKHLPGVPITITENKSIVYGKILFDDWPLYCEAWLKFRPRGLVLMPAHNYNEGFDQKYPGQVIRITDNNLAEVEQAIKIVFNRMPGEKLIIKK